MAVTRGHGNPNWTREEVILALDLYLDLGGQVPGESHPRVQELSEVLRAFPFHGAAARRASFRNPAGVAFKLQNLRQVATGRGLGNVSRVDVDVWQELGADPVGTKELASSILRGIQVLETTPDEPEEDVFPEGLVATATHLRRERNPKIRSSLIARRRDQDLLTCEICHWKPGPTDKAWEEAAFEAHHVIPLSASGAAETRLSDMALLCATCHRLLHKAIALSGEWIKVEEAKSFIPPAVLQFSSGGGPASS